MADVTLGRSEPVALEGADLAFLRRPRRRKDSKLAIQLRVIHALVWNEIDHLRGPSGFGFLAVLLEPIMHLSVICFWHYIIKERPIYGTSKVLFLATGLYPVFIFIHVSTHGRFAGKQARRRMPIETKLDIIFAASLVKAVSYVYVGIFLFAGIYLFMTEQALPYDWDAVMSSSLGLAVLGFATALINAGIEPVFPNWHAIFGPLVRAMALFSGVLFVADTYLPKGIRYWLSWNPILHGVERFRQGYYPAYPKLIYDAQYFWGSAITLLVIGFLVERAGRHFED